MADTKDTEAKASAQSGANAPDIAYLGKPAPSWKTFLTKVDAGLGFVTSGITTTVGAAMMLGKKAIPENVESVVAEWMGVSLKKIAGRTGVTAVAIGSLGLVTSYAAYSTADAADRARNYMRISGKIDQKEHSPGH